MKDREFIHIALHLARMYGVAETLEERPFLPLRQFAPMIEEWAKEYVLSGERDIVHFFEKKIKNK